MTEQDTTARRFTLDEDSARTWLEKVTAATAHTLSGEGEDPAPGEDLPEIAADWEPLSPGNETDIYSLVRTAANAGIIGCPAGCDVDFEYNDDSDGGWYRFLVDVDGMRLTLAGHSHEIRKIDGGDKTGITAALAILIEAVSTANGLLARLGEYVATRQDAL